MEKEKENGRQKKNKEWEKIVNGKNGRESPDSRPNKILRISAMKNLLELGKKVVENDVAGAEREASTKGATRKMRGGTRQEVLRKKEVFENTRKMTALSSDDHKYFVNKNIIELGKNKERQFSASSGETKSKNHGNEM